MAAIIELINETNLKAIAEEILDICINELKKDNVDYKFDVKGGVMKDMEGEANTWFYFDAKPDSVLRKFLKAMYSEATTEEENEKISMFVGTLGDMLHTTYLARLRQAVRKHVLPDSMEEAIPLRAIRIVAIDIDDCDAYGPEEGRYLFKFMKMPGAEVDMSLVMGEIAKISEEQGGSVHEIVARERVKGNPAFSGILGVETGIKYLWDISISMHVDYSLSSEVLDEIKKAAHQDKKAEQEPNKPDPNVSGEDTCSH